MGVSNKVEAQLKSETNVLCPPFVHVYGAKGTLLHVGSESNHLAVCLSPDT